jgi:hypothetical protein
VQYPLTFRDFCEIRPVSARFGRLRRPVFQPSFQPGPLQREKPCIEQGSPRTSNPRSGTSETRPARRVSSFSEPVPKRRPGNGLLRPPASVS